LIVFIAHYFVTISLSLLINFLNEKENKMANSLARDPDNIVRFQPKENTKLERIIQLTDELEAESHLFIVILGTIIGAILALFIGYHIEATAAHYLLLSALPVCLAYSLRKVYIYTLTHS